MNFYIVEKDGFGISVREITQSRSAASKVATEDMRIVDENGLQELKSRFVVTSSEDLTRQMIGLDEVGAARELLRMAKSLLSAFQVGDFDITLPSGIRSRLTKQLSKYVTNTYFKEIPLKELFKILEKNDVIPIDEDGTRWSGFLTGAEGRANIDLSYKGGWVKNSRLNIQWHKMPSGKYEVNVYVA